jgi:FAD/FMN-containing dehydrogenase
MSAALDALKVAAGEGGWSTEPDVLAAASRDWRGEYAGRTELVLRPDTVAAVQAIVQTARRHQVPLVCQGGNTGLVGGSTPDDSGREVVLSLTRLNRIRRVDADDFSLVTEAGVILSDVQAAAAAVDRLFPLSLASEGSARVGGLVATNAGGVQVLRYGTMRAHVLGLEAVLPDGSLLNGLSALRKDNTGFDLRQLLIGAEGTLGVITAAALRLVPAHRTSVVAWAGLTGAAAAVPLLARLRAATADQVNAFELMPQAGLDLLAEQFPGTSAPLAEPHDWQVLMDVASAADDPTLADRLEAALAQAVEDGLVADAVVARSVAQARALWVLRERLPEAEKREGRALKHDIAVPVSAVPAFLDQAAALVQRLAPQARVLAFGHVGDGNLHYNVRPPRAPANHPAFFAAGAAVTAALHDLAVAMGGAISAEHGIGRSRRAELARLADPAKLAAMKAVKAALDPDNLFNPGRMLG